MAMDLPRIPIKNPVGIAMDPNPTDLPPTVWSGGKNISFRNGKVRRAQGYSRVFSPPTTPPVYLYPYLNQNVPSWFQCSYNNIYVTPGLVWEDVSRTGDPYNASTEYPWNGCFLNGLVVLNNGFDVPQMFSPNSDKFSDLANWPSTYRSKIVRSFKNYLVALNITANSVHQPTTVKWSSPADPGEAPSKWTTADPTSEAGEAFLADTPGAIVDGINLRDSLIVYKEDSVYSMRHIGGVYVFQFQKLFDDIGMLAPNCAVEFDGKHFVVGQGDVYVHNGVQKSSVIEGKMKEYLFNAIRAAGAKSVFVVPDYKNSEMWICFQSSGGSAEKGVCDQALIWNWVEDHWTIRDLPNVICGTVGIVDPRAPDNWEDDSNVWNSDATVWGSDSYNPSSTKIVFGSAVNEAIYLIGDNTTFDGEYFDSYIEKTDIYMDDDLNLKSLNSVTPHVSGEGPCSVRVGSSNTPDGSVRWDDERPFNIGVSHKVDSRTNGRYIAVRFNFNSAREWVFNGYTLEFVANVGKR